MTIFGLKRPELNRDTSKLPRWNKATVKGHLVELAGLTNRRAYERDVFLGKRTVMGVSHAMV